MVLYRKVICEESIILLILILINLMDSNKLVRDKIPERILHDGRKPRTHIANDEEYWDKLKLKLKEEVNEFLEESNEEELADILEVIGAICEFKKIDENNLKKIKENKAEKKGKFKEKIILEKE